MFKKFFKIRVTKIDNESMYANHSTFHEGDSGLDLFASEDIMIPAHETRLVNLGVMCQSASLNPCVWQWLTNGTFYKYHSYLLIPRSSIAKSPLLMKNSIGLIDAGYTGELKAPMYNTSSEPFYIQRGERYVQLVNNDLSPVRFELVENVRRTSRGDGGFGSTGLYHAQPAPT
jgi:dUTP pyrophosphatase